MTQKVGDHIWGDARHAHNCKLLRRGCRWRRGDEFDVENWKRVQALTSDSVEENSMRKARAMYHHH